MSRTLLIPVRQTITLPDNWQACRTPQELSYWLISQFDEFEHNVETLAADVAALQSGLASLGDTVSNIDARLVVVEGQINDPVDGILAALAALAAADAEINAHLDDTDHNVSANAAGIYQLNVDVTAINADLVNIHDALIMEGTDIAALKTTVGDSTSGLVKKVNDLDTEINGANGLEDRVEALEQSGGGGAVYQHKMYVNVNLGHTVYFILYKTTSSPINTLSLLRSEIGLLQSFPVSGYVNISGSEYPCFWIQPLADQLRFFYFNTTLLCYLF